LFQLGSYYGPDFFNHPQCAAGYGFEFCLDYPWRFIDQWIAYPKGQRDEGSTATGTFELPYDDDDMREYVVEGYLVAPSGVRARVRLDNLMRISFDRSKDTRGWWVSAHNGDGATEAVYYRFLDPAPTSLTKGEARRSAQHLRRRALLALLSNILDVCFSTEERADYHASQPVQAALQDYRTRLADVGIRLDPLLSMFKRELQVHLAYAFDALKPRCDFFTSLARMCDVKHPSTATLLALTEIAEDISDQSQWGYPRSAESISETSSVEAPKRLKHLPCRVGGRAKKQRVDSIFPSGSSAVTLATIPQAPKEGLMSVSDFKRMLSMIKDSTGESIEDVENWSSVRLQGKCKSHQYGRILPDAMEKVFDMTSLSRDDTFVDIGSGIGTLVLQAAYSRGCASRGIEILEGRHDGARWYAEQAALCRHNFPGLKPGEWQFFCGDLRSPENSKVFLKKRSSPRLVGFCNNFGGLMGARSETNAGVSVEHYIAGQFASWPEGSVLVTLFPLLCLGMPREKAMNELTKHNMDEGDPSWASFFCAEEFALGPQNKVASWSAYSGCKNMVTAYKYTRLAQVGHPDFSVLRCLNPTCPTAQSGAAINAVKRDDNGMPLINACSCGYEQRNLRDCPQNRGYYEPDRATSTES
jgi:Histone methylation protein DOT1